jgi:hypothetical protein
VLPLRTCVLSANEAAQMFDVSREEVGWQEGRKVLKGVSARSRNSVRTGQLARAI